MTGSLLPGHLIPSRLLGGGGVTGRGPAPTLTVALGRPGSCPNEPTLLIFVFDDSGSMLGGSDSTGMRYAEATLALARVRRHCRCGRELAAILHMNRPTSADRPPTPLSRRTEDHLTSGLLVPTDGDGASAMSATLERAARMARAHPAHHVTLAAFSDFELVDDLHRLADELADFPGRVHAVVMRSAPPPQLVERDGIRVTRVESGAAQGAVARTVFDTLTVHRPGRSLSPATRREPAR